MISFTAPGAQPNDVADVRDADRKNDLKAPVAKPSWTRVWSIKGSESQNSR
jgi:hypothetical protein